MYIIFFCLSHGAMWRVNFYCLCSNWGNWLEAVIQRLCVTICHLYRCRHCSGYKITFSMWWYVKKRTGILILSSSYKHFGTLKQDLFLCVCVVQFEFHRGNRRARYPNTFLSFVRIAFGYLGYSVCVRFFLPNFSKATSCLDENIARSIQMAALHFPPRSILYDCLTRLYRQLRFSEMPERRWTKVPWDKNGMNSANLA